MDELTLLSAGQSERRSVSPSSEWRLFSTSGFNLFTGCSVYVQDVGVAAHGQPNFWLADRQAVGSLSLGEFELTSPWVTSQGCTYRRVQRARAQLKDERRGR